MSMADSDILPAACTWVFPTMGIMQYNKNATERAKEDIKGVMKALNDHLLAKTFLVGERISWQTSPSAAPSLAFTSR